MLVEESSLSLRAKDILKKKNINSLQEITSYTEGEMMRSFPINIKLLRELVAELKKHNLSFKGEAILSSKKVKPEGYYET